MLPLVVLVHEVVQASDPARLRGVEPVGPVLDQHDDGRLRALLGAQVDHVEEFPLAAPVQLLLGKRFKPEENEIIVARRSSMRRNG